MAGMGVALLPDFLIGDELKSRRLVKAIDLPMISDGAYYLVWPSERALLSAARRLPRLAADGRRRKIADGAVARAVAGLNPIRKDNADGIFDGDPAEIGEFRDRRLAAEAAHSLNLSRRRTASALRRPLSVR